MKRMHRFAVIAIVAALLLAIALPAFGSADAPEADTAEATVTHNHENLKPAVPAPPPDKVDDEQPWTVRFIYPSIAIATVILLAGLAIGYNRSVRGRYSVASE